VKIVATKGFLEDLARLGGWREKLREFPYKIWYGLKNLWYWLPVIWNDRHWGDSFFYILLRHKLIPWEKQMRNSQLMKADQEADKIKEAILLLDRLINDEYTEQVLAPHDAKWGETEIDFEQVAGGYGMHFTRKNAVTPEEKAQARKEYRRLAKHIEHLINQDIEHLFQIIQKNVRGWWD